MTKRTNVSEREHQRRAWRGAMSVQAFCERYDIGRTKAYEEINAGRLKARKCAVESALAQFSLIRLGASNPIS
jgi:hypothetical protein